MDRMACPRPTGGSLKWPRKYAEEIELRPETEWKALVLQCPPEWQELIRSHLRDYLNRRAMSAGQKPPSLSKSGTGNGR